MRIGGDAKRANKLSKYSTCTSTVARTMTTNDVKAGNWLVT